ncbi:MAG: hypothetical protein METHP_00501 [Methanoregula sp. SKADARSKE-2]|nr:MAG: hypothetical protein METHP_00501 [Methanoregula sp. SKADARSKE-2]
MSEPTTSTTNTGKKESVEQVDTTNLHTCACGETHEDHTEGVSHREACTSYLKFGDTCCCGSGKEAKGRSTPCGHGPRCH